MGNALKLKGRPASTEKDTSEQTPRARFAELLRLAVTVSRVAPSEIAQELEVTHERFERMLLGEVGPPSDYALRRAGELLGIDPTPLREAADNARSA